MQEDFRAEEQHGFIHSMLSGRLQPTPSTLPPQSLWRFGNAGCLLDILSVYSTLTSRPQTFFLFLITLSAQRPDATRASHLLACQQSHYRLVRQEEEGGEGHWGSSPFRNKAIVLHYSWRGCWGYRGGTSPFSHLFTITGVPTSLRQSQKHGGH